MHAPVARAWARAPRAFRNTHPDDLVSVHDAAGMDKALGDPGNTQHCPLCNEYMGTELFIAHAPACIQARAPRRRVWAPPGTRGAIVAYKELVAVPPGVSV